MKKTLLKASFVFSALLIAHQTQAQIAASIPDALLPTVAGPVLRPQNAGSSTLQNITYVTGATNNLYVHSWDVFSSGANNGIAYRRSDVSGTTLSQGFINVKYADDIDVALYQSGSDFFVLAAYYYNDGTASTMGHYYDIYRFDPSGLVPVTTFNLLTTSPTFGRINVDANTPYGVTVTWCRPGTGIFVKAANLPFTGFGPTVLLPGTSGFKDPDICINRYTGSLALQIVYLSNANNQIREQRLDFATAVSGAATGLTTEYSAGTINTYGSPRIDCPDAFSVQKWAVVFSDYNVSGTSVTERIYAAVKDAAWSATPSTVLVNTASYTTAPFQLNNPVVAYNVNADRIHVGWITKNNTTVIPGTADPKYVAQYVQDNGSSAPVSVTSSYMMISNQPGGPAPVLAFSGQNTMSNFNGLHTAYSQYNTSIPSNYSMNYKDKPWGSATFKLIDDQETTLLVPSVYPSPFNSSLTFVTPVKGVYDVTIISMDGRTVYTASKQFNDLEKTELNTEGYAPGLYIMRISSEENHIDYTRKLMK